MFLVRFGPMFAKYLKWFAHLIVIGYTYIIMEELRTFCYGLLILNYIIKYTPYFAQIIAILIDQIFTLILFFGFK